MAARKVHKGVPKKKLIRRWLNLRDHHSTAFIYSNMGCEEYRGVRDGVPFREMNFFGDLILSDCTRQVNLDISADANTIRKLDNLLEAIEEVRTYVCEVMEWMDTSE